MKIYVVEFGDTLDDISSRFKVSKEDIIKYNEIKDPDELVVGETLVLLYPKEKYVVKSGDTLNLIAEKFNTTTTKLLQNNPWIDKDFILNVGDEIVVEFINTKLGEYSINGYTYPNIDKDVLARTLPYLSFLTIFTYGINESGSLIDIDDTEIIDLARAYNVAPIMLISSLGADGNFSNVLAGKVLNDEKLQDVLIEDILAVMNAKNYYGLDVDFEFIYPEDREAYVSFLEKVKRELNAEGYPVFVALAPKVSNEQKGLLYEGHDYYGLGNAANLAILMTYSSVTIVSIVVIKDYSYYIPIFILPKINRQNSLYLNY